MSVCSCINGNIYNGSVTTDPLCPVHGEKAVVACSYPLCPIHFPPNRAPHPAEPTIGLTGADILRAQEEMRERCAKVADAFEAAYSTGARAVLKRIAEDIRALPLAGADALKPQDSQGREETK